MLNFLLLPLLLSQALAAPEVKFIPAEEALMTDKCNRKLSLFMASTFFFEKVPAEICSCKDVDRTIFIHFKTVLSHCRMGISYSAVACLQDKTSLCYESTRGLYPQFSPVSSARTFCDSGEVMMKEKSAKLPFNRPGLLNEMTSIDVRNHLSVEEICEQLMAIKCKGKLTGGSGGSGEKGNLKSDDKIEKPERKNLH